MKILFFTAIALFGGVGMAQAACNLNDPNSCGPNAYCSVGGPIQIGVPPLTLCVRNGTPPPPTVNGPSQGNNQNTNGNNGNTNQNSQTGARPCGQNAMNNIPTVLTSWGVGAAATPPARPATPPPTLAQSFMQTILGLAASIVAGDNVWCPVTYTPEGQKFVDCLSRLEQNWKNNNPVIPGDRTYTIRLQNARAVFIEKCTSIEGSQAYDDWKNPKKSCEK